MVLIARIITGNAEYVRYCPYEKRQPIWKICAETMKQLESEQWLRSKGFVCKLESCKHETVYISNSNGHA